MLYEQNVFKKKNTTYNYVQLLTPTFNYLGLQITRIKEKSILISENKIFYEQLAKSFIFYV